MWTIKDLQLVMPKMAHFMHANEDAKILLISVNQDHDEKEISQIQSIFRVLKLEEFARSHKDVLVVVGYPQILYHLPIKDLVVNHYDSIEVRGLFLQEN